MTSPKLNQASKKDIIDMYSRARGSAVFFYGLSILTAGWILAHWWWGIDQGLVDLIAFLSIEASLMLSAYAMKSDRDDARNRKQMEYLLHLMEGQQTLMESLQAHFSNSSD